MSNATIAPLKNVALFNEALDRVMHRPEHISGIITFHGHSGFGKTTSAIYGANQYNAHVIEVGDSWNKTKFCDAILQVLGIHPKGTIAHKMDQIIEGLMQEDRPLIIDEADFVVKKKFHEMVREIHDKSHAPIIMIGEELLPTKLQEFERFHNRVSDWIEAQPADLEDTMHLTRMYCPEIKIHDDILRRVHKLSQGRIRRICVNLENINQYAQAHNLKDINEIPDKLIFTGLPPIRDAA